MKKQRIQMAVLAGLCLLCVCAYFLVKNLDLSETEEEQAASVAVTDFAKDDVIRLDASVQGYELHFVKEDGVWYNTDDREAAIDQTAVESLLMDIDNITTDKVIEKPEELADYGLQEPSGTIEAVKADGTGVALSVGTTNDLTGDYYIKRDDSTTVYAVNSYIVTDFMKGPEAFVQEETESAADTEVEPAAESTSDTDS